MKTIVCCCLIAVLLLLQPGCSILENNSGMIPLLVKEFIGAVSAWIFDIKNDLEAELLAEYERLKAMALEDWDKYKDEILAFLDKIMSKFSGGMLADGVEVNGVPAPERRNSFSNIIFSAQRLRDAGGLSDAEFLAIARK